jgi:hypothetical protein
LEFQPSDLGLGGQRILRHRGAAAEVTRYSSAKSRALKDKSIGFAGAGARRPDQRSH